MATTRERFGSIDGKPVDLYTLVNANGLVLRVTNFGATVTHLEVPDRDGKLADVVLGFDDVDSYEARGPYFGCTVGRVANRIRGARFELEGKVYLLTANDGTHQLHGGAKGWDKAVWSAEAAETQDGPAVRMTHVSRDGDNGYPATVTASCVYTLTKKNELRVEMRATSDGVTLINMAHHGYWNLGGEGSGSITGHELTLHARAYTPGDPMVPTGEVKSAAGTPFDFTKSKPIGRDLAAVGGTPVGYDHNFVVDGPPATLRPVARLHDPGSGRMMELAANQAGVQFYSGNFLDGTLAGKGGRLYPQHAGVCLETQAFPNAINVPGWGNQVILRPGNAYHHVMIHSFSIS
jgi:aldose 1-epimerase